MRVVALIAALAALTACGSSPTGPTLDSPVTLPGGFSSTTLTRGSMNATVDGARWDAQTPLATVTTSTAFPGSGDRLSVSGLATSSGLFITFNAPLAAGTYDLANLSGLSSPFVTFGILQGLGAIWSANPSPGASGILTLTTASTSRVSGTFSFTATTLTAGVTPATRAVTNGVFDLSR